jgi:hypothetical protein
MGEPPAWAEVAFSVYELHGTSAINYVTSSAGIGGAYHVGVEVYGLEWSYGGSDVGTGVYCVHVRESSLGSFHSRVTLGRTRKTAEQVLDILDEFRRTWMGDQYHILAKNCAHFCMAFTERLGFDNQPEWINKLAKVGAGLTGAQAARLSLTDARARDGLDAFDDDELEDFAEDGDQVALLELVWRRGKEFTLEWVDHQKQDSKYQDIVVEFRFAVPSDDPDMRNAALGVMAVEGLRDAVAQSTASALDLSNNDLQVNKLQALSGLRVSATLRGQGGSQKKIAQKSSSIPRADFAASFRSAMKDALWWRKEQQAALDTLIIETVPGQAAMGHRVLLSSKMGQNRTGGGAVYFPRKDFRTPDSITGNLAKLQKLRITVAEQSCAHRTLMSMQQKTAQDLPWWATDRTARP